MKNDRKKSEVNERCSTHNQNKIGFLTIIHCQLDTYERWNN